MIQLVFILYRKQFRSQLHFGLLIKTRFTIGDFAVRFALIFIIAFKFRIGCACLCAAPCLRATSCLSRLRRRSLLLGLRSAAPRSVTRWLHDRWQVAHGRIDHGTF